MNVQFGGKDTLVVDKTLRMLGINRMAEAMEKNLLDEDRKM